MAAARVKIIRYVKIRSEVNPYDPICGQPLRIAEEDCQIHHRVCRSRGGTDTADNMELMHANCHRQVHVQKRRTEAAASREGRS